MPTIFQYLASTALRAATPAALALLLVSPANADAQVKWEVESDPLAYALNGFSIHGAAVLGAGRVSVGTFGVDIPRVFHGNDGWDAVVRGVTLKLDYLGSSIDGFFAGVEGNYARTRYTLRGDDARERRGAYGVGIRGGYRIPLGQRGLYVVPWASVSYSFDGDDVIIGSETFDGRSVTVFPAVHIGWRF